MRWKILIGGSGSISVQKLEGVLLVARRGQWSWDTRARDKEESRWFILIMMVSKTRSNG
jgi:hypothetical protein